MFLSVLFHEYCDCESAILTNHVGVLGYIVRGVLVVNVLLAPARHICGVGAAILRATGSNLATEAMFLDVR